MPDTLRNIHEVNWPQWCSYGVWDIGEAVKLFCNVEPTAECSPITWELHQKLSAQEDLFYRAAEAGKFLNSAGQPFVLGTDKYLQPLSVLKYATEKKWNMPEQLKELHKNLLKTPESVPTLGMIADPENPYYSKELHLAAQYQQLLPQWLEGVTSSKHKQAIVAQLKKLEVKPKALLDRLAVLLNPTSSKRK